MTWSEREETERAPRRLMVAGRQGPKMSSNRLPEPEDTLRLLERIAAAPPDEGESERQIRRALVRLALINEGFRLDRDQIDTLTRVAEQVRR